MVQAHGSPLHAIGRRLPTGSCDCHFHIFDQSRYAYAADRSYTPPDATLAHYQAIRAQWGIDRAVLIHPSVFGADHSSFEELLGDHADWLRGVAVAYPDTPESVIERWHRLGSRGSRINALFAGGPGLHAMRSLVDKIRPLNWHLQLLIDLVESPTFPQQVADLGLPVVVDHMGHHAVDKLLHSPGLRNLLALMAEGRAWVKLSAPYRLSAASARYAELDPLVERFVQANAQRIVWGTDWPHPSSPHPLPTDASLIERVFDWLPDEDLRQQVLVHNPTALYWSDHP
jgi:predicted TIM-barrel fold metal-dependent hydrolase